MEGEEIALLNEAPLHTYIHTQSHPYTHTHTQVSLDGKEIALLHHPPLSCTRCVHTHTHRIALTLTHTYIRTHTHAGFDGWRRNRALERGTYTHTHTQSHTHTLSLTHALTQTPGVCCAFLPCAYVSRTASTSSAARKLCHGRCAATNSDISIVSQESV